MSGAGSCIFLALSLAAYWMIYTVHFINEGYVGVYTRGGALLNGVYESGIHFSIPMITQFHPIQITVQTDKVTNIPCGTSGGVLITFDRIEVVNRLRKEMAWETIKNYTVDYDKTWIFDKIHHEINQFCSSHTLHEVYVSLFDQLDENIKKNLEDSISKWAPGIEIIAVRVTKPRLPTELSKGYEDTELEKTKYLLSVEQKNVKLVEAETTKKSSIMEAETEAEVAMILNKIKLEEENGQIEIRKNSNEIAINHEKVKAEAEHYKMLKQNEINKMRLSPEFIRYTALTNIKEAPKVFFGEDFNDMIGSPGSSKESQKTPKTTKARD